jgi:type IV pilus assembly protein PilY1
MVYFGTGQYIATTDNGTSEQQTFYGIWDSGSTVSSRSVLQPQVMTTSAYRTISDDPVNYSTPVSSSTKYGWYIDLDSTERVTVDPLAIGDVVFFNTLLPPTSTCGYGGSGWLMVVDQLNGGEPAFPTVDTNGDGVVDIDDTLAGGTVIAGVKSGDIPSDVTILPNYRFDNNPASGTAINAIGSTPSGRMSWTGLERK